MQQPSGAGPLTNAAEGARHQCSLAGAVGRRQAAAAPVLVDGGAVHIGDSGILAASWLQDGHSAALATAIAISGHIKRLAAAHRGQCLQGSGGGKFSCTSCTPHPMRVAWCSHQS